MNYKTWLVKAIIPGLCISMLASSFAHAVEYGPTTISTYFAERGQETIFPFDGKNILLHTGLQQKFYKLRSDMPIWIDSSGNLNQMAFTLRTTLLSAYRHGLNPQDYWDSTLEKVFVKAQEDSRYGITFEVFATEAMLRYGKHLFQGRVVPSSLEKNIKYTGNIFGDKELRIVAKAVSKNSDGFVSALEVLAPQLPRYKDFMGLLGYFRSLKANENWTAIKAPGFTLEKGVRADAVVQIRQRFNQLGYKVSTDSDIFDNEFDAVLRRFQRENGLTIDGTIGANRSVVLQLLNKNIDERIAQIELTMEKLRWLSRTFESRFIFVNLATSEFRLFEGTKVALSFKTVNGQKLRQTPSMKDVIRKVVFNPIWTVPDTLAAQDKWPLLKQDASYLVKHNMIMTQNSRRVDATVVDWYAKSANDFYLSNPSRYVITQTPGYDNALGVVKFPMEINDESIYMHDTNERDLFKLGERHKSSGCVRLEQPLKLAEYLLRENKGQWSMDKILNIVPSTLEAQSRESIEVKLANEIPVYLMYLTVERGTDGSIRFLRDDYGQDERLLKALNQINVD